MSPIDRRPTQAGASKRGSRHRVQGRNPAPPPAGQPTRRQLPPPDRYRYELRPGLADFHRFPRSAWKAALVRALREMPDGRLTYADHRGVPELRNAVSEYLARMRGVVLEPEQVVICCAASQALTVLWRVLRDRGARRVAIEDPAWRWQRYTVEQAGLEAVPVRVDEHGPVVQELPAADVDAVVMNPAHHYPTGVVMTAERRSALIAWARERQALIVEDDYDVEYRFGRPPMASLQGLEPDLVAFVCTTSKTLAPALRLAWVVRPSDLIDDVENVLLVTGVTPPTLDQIAMASFIETRRWNAICGRCAGATARSARSSSTRSPRICLTCAWAAPRRACTWWPGFPTARTSTQPPWRREAAAWACMNCTGIAPRTRHLRRLLGFALPSDPEMITATRLLADALC